MNTEDKIVFPLSAPLTMEWEKDKIAITEAAQQPTTADKYYFHAASIQSLFNILTFGTRSAPKHPQRSGLLRKVHDELFPIANFAKLYFSESKEVLIQWVDGNQNYDATVEYLAENLGFPDIRYLEVTTLQGSEDAKQLEELSEGNNITTISESDHETHVRKINLFETALKKKSGKTYPPKRRSWFTRMKKDFSSVTLDCSHQRLISQKTTPPCSKNFQIRSGDFLKLLYIAKAIYTACGHHSR